MAHDQVEEQVDCTCPDPIMRWMPHTTSIDSSVSISDIRWLLDAATCPVEKRAIRRIIVRREQSRVS